ncbi:branched-chain amino acid ABC transporter permease [Candidatus Poribacteria bacterium]|nr:branched-chain amino acid ABC transporter permease [Candidatus Poribacteria bacterium]
MMLIQFVANGVVSGCIFGLVALGFGLIYRTTKVFHIAHGAVYTATAYLFYGFLTGWKLPWLMSLMATLLSGTLLGLFIEYGVYYPLYRRGASSGVVLISSLGLYTVIVNIIAMGFGNETKILSPGVEPTVHLASVILTRIQIVELAVFAVLTAVTLAFLRFSRVGQLIQAAADNAPLVSVVGVNLRYVRLLVFGIGSFLAGMAACLVALDVGMDPHGGMNMLLTAAVAVIVGGVEVFSGAVVTDSRPLRHPGHPQTDAVRIEIRQHSGVPGVE